MNVRPIPSRPVLRGLLAQTPRSGRGRSQLIRDLYLERCSILEIRLALLVTSQEVRRALRGLHS